MVNLRTFSHVLATVFKLFYCSILYFEMFINPLNVEYKFNHKTLFVHFVYSNKERMNKQNKIKLLLKFNKVFNLSVER